MTRTRRILCFLWTLLQNDIAVNQPGFNGVTALHVAVSQRCLAMASVLVAAGADVMAECDEPLEALSDDDEITDYLTPLNMASSNQQVYYFVQEIKQSG